MITVEIKSNHTESSGKSKLRGILYLKKKRVCVFQILKDEEKPRGCSGLKKNKEDN